MSSKNNDSSRLRTVLDASHPGWEAEVRRDLDQLTPGWTSLPVRVWDPENKQWSEVVLVANPSPVPVRRVGGHFTRLLRWFRWW